MSVGIETLAPYVPRLVRDRLASCPDSRAGAELVRARGAVLFTDVSGFTALSERLARRGPTGAEALGRLLNAYFTALIGLVERSGGDPLKLIGDALVALWTAGSDDEAGMASAAMKATACAWRIRGELAEFDPGEEGESPLRTKVGLGAGELLAMRVGGERERWELLITGDPLAQMGRAETQAKPGEVVVAPEVWTLIADSARGEPVERGCVRISGLFHVDNYTNPTTPPPPGDEALPALWSYVPGAIRDRLKAGQGGWLSELRLVSVLFVGLPGLGGIGPGDLSRAQAAVEAIQKAVYRFEGSINKLSTDEKGVTLLAALGLPPLAHADDACRAARAALAIKAALAKIGEPCKVGVATGRVYCGEVGAPSRREYSLFGDTVNLAARLMGISPEHGGVVCDGATRRDAGASVGFEPLGRLAIKGRGEPVEAFRPTTAASLELGHATSPIVGRVSERKLLAERLDALNRGEGGVVLISGEAGIGKSRLLADWAETAKARGITVLRGAGDAIERTSPYRAWRSVVVELLGLGDLSQNERAGAARDRLRAAVGPDRPLALLAPFLAVDLPGLDSDVGSTTGTGTWSGTGHGALPPAGEARAEAILDLVFDLLARRLERDPILLILEDAHWFDSASWAVAHRLAARGGPILLAIATRPLLDDPPPSYRKIAALPGLHRIDLEPLGATDVLELAAARLGVDALPNAAAALIDRCAQGHPFYGEELALALRDAGLLVVEGRACHEAPGSDWSDVRFTDSIERVVAERIGRLDAEHSFTLKVASVVGRLFALRVVRAVYPAAARPDGSKLAAILDGLHRRDLTRLETADPELAYLFKHIITKEVAYGLVLPSQRKELHRAVAAWHEADSAAEPEARAPILAHHWARTDEPSKALPHLDIAAASAMRSGADLEALGFAREALALDKSAPGSASARREALAAEACLALGRIVEGRGHAARALDGLGRPLPKGRLGLAAGYAREFLVQAAHRARAPRSRRTEAQAAEVRAASAILHVLGNLCYYAQDVGTGVYAALRALNLAERAGPSPELARGYATMCIAAGLVPFHPLARAFEARARAAAEEAGDPVEAARVAELTGVYWLGVGRRDRARANLEAAEARFRDFGEWRRWEESVGELARLDYLEGDLVRAEARFVEMGEVARRRGHDQAAVWSRHGRSNMRLWAGRLDEAVADLEGSPAVRADSGIRIEEADAILGLGLLAAARWRLGLESEAIEAAEAVARLSAPRPMVNYSLEGFSGAAEVFLGAWERAGARNVEARRRAMDSCAVLRRFASIFPIGRPRALVHHARALELDGRRHAALRAAHAALRAADRFAMPIDRTLAHDRLAALDPSAIARDRHAGLARDLRDRLGINPPPRPPEG